MNKRQAKKIHFCGDRKHAAKLCGHRWGTILRADARMAKAGCTECTGLAHENELVPIDLYSLLKDRGLVE